VSRVTLACGPHSGAIRQRSLGRVKLTSSVTRSPRGSDWTGVTRGPASVPPRRDRTPSQCMPQSMVCKVRTGRAGRKLGGGAGADRVVRRYDAGSYRSMNLIAHLARGHRLAGDPASSASTGTAPKSLIEATTMTLRVALCDR
jgi:hypothetical protein